MRRIVRIRRVVAITLTCSVAALANADESSISIVRGYEGMSRYADAATYAEPKAYSALFHRHVFQRYEQQCAGPGSTRQTSRNWLLSPINDIGALHKALEQIRHSDATERILEAAERAARELPGGPVTICVFAYPPDIESSAFVADVMGGAMGF
ncbi:MAG: hypothetical protein KJO31_05780, partial [Gammaproteobacteria bacterium]|nr:hypothetical protein [Gammaproteobacteria bacterium]